MAWLYIVEYLWCLHATCFSVSAGTRMFVDPALKPFRIMRFKKFSQSRSGGLARGEVALNSYLPTFLV